ncbi:MAG: helicase-exonuclease AddAB subunit AddA [Lachnospiraceae bacterium]|nr:helicase-exonuclease AddAB subunit AddA [Lachnospiraceae bacterium]
MSVEFTTEQKQVIELRDCNILVSAAAGSGKTAVLTERIVNMICDEEHPVDVDRLLVVTFTAAAASEMRERIGNKLSDRLNEHPENERLQRQATLLHSAQITTIDSFCLFLLKNHFNEIGLDPAFRVADEREIKLLQQEALSELLEERFEEGRPAFLDCVEALCPKGKEKTLEEHVLSLSRYAASFPWPKEWLRLRMQDYAQRNEGDFTRTELWKYLLHYVKGVLAGCQQKMDQAIAVTLLPDGPHFYGELLENEKSQMASVVDKLGEAKDLMSLSGLVTSVTFEKLPGVKDPSVDPDKRKLAQEIRNGVKKVLDDLEEQFFSADYSLVMQRTKGSEPIANELLQLVIDFDKRMRDKKTEKKIIDFSDMEHFALDILLRREGESIVPTQVAKQYREYFQEVLIDEYQDSNLVQEYLLSAVSGEEDGRYDRFMVGDVKQSIYHFRLARPELFLEKYGTYQKTGPLRRIDLSKNFRSRGTVIETVNHVFERTMSAEVGGIVYDDDAALHAGAVYPEAEGLESELLIVQDPGAGSGLDAKQAEARAVARRISELRRNGKVYDAQAKEMREVKYRDIVILLRSLSSGWGDAYKAELEAKGIPAYVTSKTGYFTATEVQAVLNFLRVIDNPLQDIPMFGVLRSFFGGFTEEEIAKLRGEKKDQTLYECLLEAEDEKVTAFLQRLQGFREMTSILPIRALLEKILWEYDYLNYVTALPSGSKRRANLEMLLVKASDFEKTSFYGLFHFLRYIEMLEKYDEDYGEADTLDENADVVRIMSIHKSKGLEFPVTIVSGLSKGFNMKDVNKSVITEADLGIGLDFVDPVRRVRYKMLQKNIIAKKLREDTLAEELRLLYVALTRAKEKLILTGTVSEPEKFLAESELLSGKTERLSYLEFMKATCMMDFLKPILLQTGLEISVIPAAELLGAETEEQLTFELSKGALEHAKEKADEVLLADLRERFTYEYPHAKLQDLYTKTTVSELKIAAMSEKDEAAYHAFEDTVAEPYVPEFRRQEESVTGTVRGNAYHRVMELMDFTLRNDEAGMAQAVRELLQKLSEEHRLSEEYRNAVRVDKICQFLKSGLGERIMKAQQAGKLFREQPFVLSLPATRLREDFPGEESVLIQGIIDVYFEEEDGLVLLDYKTDAVPDLEMLWQRYETQLDYYQEALERLTGKKVKERILYSFHLGQY